MELRLIPVVAFAAASLLAVKVVTIAQFDGRSPFATAFAQTNTAAAGQDDVEFTGSTGAAKKPQDEKAEKTAKPKLKDGEPVAVAPPDMDPAAIIPGGVSPAERALLSKLGERRKELDARTRDVEMRENLLKDAEARLQTRIDELKEIENRINGKGGVQMAKLKNIVVMYEGMKPKDAARIFEKLDQTVLVDVAAVMKPSKLSDILAQMDAESAQRLPVELAKRSSGGEQGLPSTDLKKIDGSSGT
jgi:flagellar motility protein MotE (MotC chaperone)